jgi:hypothetical protein
MTLAQIAEKPITVTTVDRISNFAEGRQGRLAMSLRRPNGIGSLPEPRDAPKVVAAGLSGDNDTLMS